MRLARLSLPLLALAACNGEDDSIADEQRERAEAAAASADGELLLPGRWETKSRLTATDRTDISEEEKAALIGQDVALDQCLPADEAARPDPNFLIASDVSECEYERFEMADGIISATLACTATPGEVTMNLDGTYTPTSYAIEALATTTGIPGPNVNSSATLSGTWLGDCPDPREQAEPDKD